jgi:hypothetical protein
MKAIKIGLATVVVATILFFIVKFLVSIGDVGKISLPKNQFTKRIEKETETLRKIPDNQFSKNAYDDINHEINAFYKEQKFGKNKNENDQWKENLSKNLYSAYADKFIKQAFYVFNGSVWNLPDLNFIRNEYKSLQNSQFLQRSSPVDLSFINIQKILGKYDEITSFIASSKNYAFTDYSFSTNFPMQEVESKISVSAKYKNNKLENSYVNNCIRLHNDLNKVPDYLFNAHIKYLNNKLNQFIGTYSYYNSQGNYAKDLYNPMKSQINMLDNNIYNVANFDNEYDKLINRLIVDSENAYNYFNPTN